MRPSMALLSYWGGQAAGYGGALIPEQDVATRALAPFEGKRIFLANEAFGALRGSDGVLGQHHGWAECSLVMAENVLTREFGLQPPHWISSEMYDKFVRFNSSAEARAQRDSWR